VIVTLVEFLLARLAEDEEMARSAPGPRWVAKYRQKPEPPFAVERYAIASPVEFMGQELGAQTVAFTEDDTAESKALVYHAVRWGPARVLAECAVKRRLIEEHGEGQPWSPARNPGRCRVCTAIGPDGGAARFRAPCPTLRLLALPYADHPDYDHGSWAA
jgi:hypothetical protein